MELKKRQLFFKEHPAGAVGKVNSSKRKELGVRETVAPLVSIFATKKVQLLTENPTSTY